MQPILKTYHSKPLTLNNILHDEYYGGRMETYHEKVNISEDENSFSIDVVAPGFNKNEIKISIQQNELTIASIEENEEGSENKFKYIRREFVKKPFNRKFKLPENTEIDNISASHNNGILCITIPKKAKIEIPVKDIKVQ